MTRTQVYLSKIQRRLLDEEARGEGISLAEVVRRAVDQYFRQGRRGIDSNAALESTLGVLPDLDLPPRAEWERSFG